MYRTLVTIMMLMMNHTQMLKRVQSVHIILILILLHSMIVLNAQKTHIQLIQQGQWLLIVLLVLPIHQQHTMTMVIQ